jgi:repressor LexA
MTLTKRQKEILDYLKSYAARHGYSPTLAEVRDRFRLNSLATVHKHLKNLEGKGFVRRERNRSRAVEVTGSSPQGEGAAELPLLGVVAAGLPIEALETRDSIAVPKELARGGKSFALKVRGDSMIDEQIRDGDCIVVESRATAENGETVVALVEGAATVKKFYREATDIVVLRPANPALMPLIVPADRVEIRGVVVAVIRKY